MTEMVSTIQTRLQHLPYPVRISRVRGGAFRLGSCGASPGRVRGGCETWRGLMLYDNGQKILEQVSERFATTHWLHSLACRDNLARKFGSYCEFEKSLCF